MKDFLEIDKDRIIYQDEYFFIIKDNFPVSPGHLLIISNKVKKDYWNLDRMEIYKLLPVIDKAKEIIEKEYKPDGYNIGMNCGKAAGQTIFHFHCHIIPRYNGDMENPRGGIRHCVSGKGNY